MNGRHLPLIALAATVVLSSCQESDAPTAARGRALTPSVHIGEWTVRLKPLNPEWGYRAVTGTARITSAGEGGTFTIEIEARGLQPGMLHAQHIHGFTDGSDGVCPKPTADVNKDKVVDVIEGLPDYGGVLLTLDGDLTNGATHDLASLPNPDNAQGRIRYVASAPYEAVNAALNLSIPLERRHIVIHGVAGPVPSTAQGLGPFTGAQALPVACGVIERVS